MAGSDRSRSDGGIALSDSAISDRNFGGRFAWKARDLTRTDWHVPLTSESLAELGSIASALADYDGNIEELAPDAFDWPATTELMTEVRSRLAVGVGAAVLDRLPVESWGARPAKAVGWLLTSLLGNIVKQKLNGARLYDVRDTGTTMGHGVRRSITNLEQELHTDGGWLPATPEFIALACIRKAARGGLNRLASLATAHSELYKRSPELLAALYRPLWWDRQAEHPPGEVPCSRRPMYAWDGDRPVVRYYDDYVRQGFRLMGEELDAPTDEALIALKSILEDPANFVEFAVQPGQIQFVNNQVIAHARTAFEDSESGEDTGRLMVRLWVRSSGGIEFEPAATATAAADA